MNSLFLLVPIGVLFVALAAGILVWAVRADQFEDLEEASHLPDQREP
jgi:cbb3-type cytochrome oxidase maturation protein